MSVDQDILRTLQKIEKHLSASSVTASNSASKAGIAGGGNTGGSGDSGKKSDTRRQKIYKATSASLEQLTDSADGLNKGFLGLNKTILMTRSGFVALNKQIRSQTRVNKEASTLLDEARGLKGDVAPPGNSLSPLAGKLPAVVGGMTGLGGIVNKVTGSLSAFRGTTDATANAARPLPGIFKELGKVIDTLINDSFHLLSRGVGAKSLGTLYFDAARAGMSLREYSELMSKSMPAVSRFSDFDTFGDALAKSNSELAKFGIFGKDAAQLSASMMTTSASLGVAQSQWDSGARAQVGVFEELRKSTMMTAAEFKNLSDELSGTQEVQSELLGMDKNERAARVTELTRMRLFGQTVGASAAASKALGDALIQQRNLTATQRFQAAGVIRQAGAITGMSSQDAERLAMLARKKNLTAEDAVIAKELGGKLQSQLESLMNTGNILDEHKAEQLQAALDSSGIGKLLKASGNVDLASQSGEVVNADLGKAANSLESAAGQLMAAATGLSKNPIAMSIAAIVGGMLTGAFVKNMFSSMGSFGKRGVEVDVGGKGEKGGVLKSLSNGVKSIFSTAGSAVAEGTKSIGGKITSSVSSVFGKIFSFIPKLLTGGLLKTIPILGTVGGMLIDGIGEAITGTVDAAFNSDGGNIFSRIGNTMFAAVSGLFGGLADLADSAIGLFTDKGLNLRNTWDRFAVTVKKSIMNLLASITSVLPFGLGESLTTYFTEAAKDCDTVLEQLAADQTSTVASIGKGVQQQRKAVEDSNKAAAKVSENLNKTVYSTVGLADVAVASANKINNAVNAVPSSEVRPMVIPPVQQPTSQPVNTPAASTLTQAKAEAAKQATEALKPTKTDVNVAQSEQLAKVINILEQSLVQSIEQTNALQSLLNSIRSNKSLDNLSLMDNLSHQL